MRSLTLITALAALSLGLPPGDEFDNPASLSSWQVMQGDLQDGVATRYEVASGQLTIVPGRSWWFGDTRAFFLYKQVRGDFKATMLVDATGQDGGLPTANWSLSGILVRAPTADRARENWVSLRSGAVNGSPVFERKTTRTSHSDLALTQAVPGWVQLRIVRLGPRFVLLRRYPGKPWQVHWVYSRYDLPATLQVGIDAFSGDEDTKADLVSHVDYFHYAATGVPAALERSYLAGTGRLAKLLPYLSR